MSPIHGTTAQPRRPKRGGARRRVRIANLVSPTPRKIHQWCMPAMPVDINGLRSLEGETEWEWTCGKFDFHVHYDPEVDSWVLEKFLSSESDPDRAHELEQECESLADALLFSIGEAEE